MSGMPSARGCEFKGPMAATNFANGFDNIPRNPDGTMVVDPQHDPKPPEPPKPPEDCNDCTLIGNCDASCALGSEQCRRMLGI
jgi:hypothetical protein